MIDLNSILFQCIKIAQAQRYSSIVIISINVYIIDCVIFISYDVYSPLFHFFIIFNIFAFLSRFIALL